MTDYQFTPAIEESVLRSVSRRYLGEQRPVVLDVLRQTLPHWDEDNLAVAADNISRGIELPVGVEAVAG